MAERLEVYKCNECGNIVEIMHGAGGKLNCCGDEMALMVENTVDAAKEKHVPAIKNIEGGVKVCVGEVAHPMADDHYIVWIEVINDDQVYQQYLNPGEAPEATFNIGGSGVTARAYCNLHGHWKS